MKKMIDYNKYLNEFVEQKGNLTCYPYLLMFVNFASTSNTRVDELHELHENWKHQIGRSYTQSYRNRCRQECNKFIQYIMDTYKSDTQRKRKITIHNTIRGVKLK